MKKILIIGTGGTITAKRVNGSWVPGSFDEKTLLDYVPEINDIAEISVSKFLSIDSTEIQPEFWIKIAKIIRKNYSDYDGFLITHGTDTIHYSAAALSFLIQNLSKPIVLTGATIPPHKLSSDSKRNLMDSIRVITETNLTEVVIVFNSRIYRGNRTKKFREYEFDAYESVNMSPLGVIEEDIRLIDQVIENKKTKPIFFDKLEKNIILLKLTPGFNPELISHLINLDYKGILIEAFGPGNVPIKHNSLLPQIKKAIEKNVPVIICSQCPKGVSWMYLYECGIQAYNLGAIPGYDMTSETALIKLMWLLGNHKNLSNETIKEIFEKNISGEKSKVKNFKDKQILDYSL